MAEQAARDPDRVFWTLAHRIDEDFLREAYRHTSKSSAAGIDGVTAQQYAEHLDDNLRDLHERLRSAIGDELDDTVVRRFPVELFQCYPQERRRRSENLDDGLDQHGLVIG